MLSIDSPKFLFCFAHRGEAKAFFEHYQFQKINFIFDGLYESKEAFLLLSGEGAGKAGEKLACVLTAFKGKISQVVNLGTAGSLQSQNHLHEVFMIRTSYKATATGPQYQSFQLHDKLEQRRNKDGSTRPLPLVDCITSELRVLEPAQAKDLACFASVVDRELWGLASVCDLLGSKIIALKIVSDSPQESSLAQTEKLNLCEVVRSQANVLSDKLLQAFLCLADQSQPTQHPAPALLAFSTSGLHFTESMKNQYRTLLSRYQLSFKCAEADFLQTSGLAQLQKSKLTEKTRALLLLQELRDELNPHMKKIKTELESLVQPLQQDKIQVRFCDNFETDEVQFHFSTSSQADLNGKLKKIAQFSFARMQNVLNGQE